MISLGGVDTLCVVRFEIRLFIRLAVFLIDRHIKSTNTTSHRFSFFRSMQGISIFSLTHLKRWREGSLLECDLGLLGPADIVWVPGPVASDAVQPGGANHVVHGPGGKGGGALCHLAMSFLYM